MASVGAQVLFMLAAGACALVAYECGGRPGPGVDGAVAAVTGSAGLVVGFGLAAAGQPAIGRLHLDGHREALAVYRDMYSPLTMTVLICGAVLFAASTVVLARALPRQGVADRLGVVAFGASGPLIGVLGVLVHELQTAGSLAGLLGATLVARRTRRLVRA